MSDDDDDQSPQDERQRQRSRSRDRANTYAHAPQTPPIPAPQTQLVPPVQPMVIQEPFTVPDEDSRSSKRQRSKSRERAPANVPIYTDDESAAVEPQSRVSDRSRSPQGKESPKRQKGKKTTARVKKPRDLPRAKKHKPMDSDEDDEVPQKRTWNVFKHSGFLPRTTSPVRICIQFTQSIDPRDNDDEHREGESGPATQCARSRNSGRTVLRPNLCVLTNDEHLSMTPAHKCAAAAAETYLSNQVPEEEIQWVDRSDQLPVHMVHRPVLLRPVHKVRRPVPALRMNPLTMMTSTEKENLAQQCKVHEVMTPEEQCSAQNDEHWTMTPEAHQCAAAAGSFCFVTAENGEQQERYNLTTIPGVQGSLCLQELIDDSSNTTS